ncbi:MAG: UDP-glucose/GDP-mannose dehydrogenase family protein [Armatimonadota bacterium]|nr:UDP-glucose/GDP-mannose dehydrogenase family protein [Armatimonadota bacterium]
MKITIIGTGYVGLVTAVGFAELGHHVLGVDQDVEKVSRLKAGDPVIYEPGLPELMARQQASGRLHFTTEIAEGVAYAPIAFICVGTPPRPDGSADLSQMEAVAREVAASISEYRLVVEKSTVPVHTSNWIHRTLRLYSRPGAEFEVASNPEFLREGSAVHDFFHPDRIVLGVPSPRAASILEEIYAPFQCPKIVTDPNTAEIIKHACNSFLALKISYINLMADLCERAEADVEVVARAMGLDQRIGAQFLQAGLGYGGACFPKDIQAFIRIGEEHGLDFGLLRKADEVNQGRAPAVLQKLKRALWVLEGKEVAILGLAFKPNTDDVRGSQSLAVAQALLENGARLRLYDPHAAEKAKKVLPPGECVTYAPSAMEALRGANACVLATAWDEFRALDLAAAARAMQTPIMVDARNFFDPDAARAAGLEYHCMGRKPVCLL